MDLHIYRFVLPVVGLLILYGCSGGSGSSDETIPNAAHFDTANTQNIFILNDTGWVNCLYEYVSVTCDPAIHLPQDGMYGRDFEYRMGTLAKLGDGPAGFDFVKLDVNGTALADQNASYSTDPWRCVADVTTGLVWEIKTNDGSLQDAFWSYSWYNPDETVNGGFAGYQDSGSCDGSLCDTKAYIEAINSMNLCGYNDWRLPSKEELHSIFVHLTYGQYLDPSYFPNETHSWSSTTQADSPDRVWMMNAGYIMTRSKGLNAQIRLVRGNN